LAIKPVVLEFPIIITDYPSAVSASLISSLSQPDSIISTETPSTPMITGGDDAVRVDLDLPEYTPRYEPSSPSSEIITN
jgi:hypothetical protein